MLEAPRANESGDHYRGTRQAQRGFPAPAGSQNHTTGTETT